MLITRPSRAGGAHFCKTVRKVTLPRPLQAPTTKSAAAAPASPPRYGIRQIPAASIMNTAEANMTGALSPPVRAAASVPISPPTARQASSAP